MPGSLEALYQEIANMINESIEEPWTRAWIVANMEEDNANFEFQYLKAGDASENSFAWQIDPKIDAVYHAFKQLRSMLKEEGKQPWRSATFTLEQDGTFKINFVYD